MKDLFLNEIKHNEDYAKDFISRSTYNSNKIEGSSLTQWETYAVLYECSNENIIGNAREFFEVINHRAAIDYLIRSIEDELSIDMIRQLGIIINKNIKSVDDFRTCRVYIGGSNIIPPNPQEVLPQLERLLNAYLNSNESDIYLKEAQAHVFYETIHPFIDGNGRTGRLLIQRGFIKEGCVPPVIEIEERTKYLNLLNQRDYIGLAKLFKDSSEREESRLLQFQ